MKCRPFFLVISGLIALFFAGSGCKTSITGQRPDNLPPQTFTTLDTIILTGDDRLTSRVHIRWWGDDPDGFVVGYEFSFDDPVQTNTVWSFTKRLDSIFLLAPPPGNDTFDFRFTVRAVDNEGLRDPTPATLVYPVKNSPPVVSFVPGLHNPVRSFPALRFFWSATDPDGPENLSHFELCWNDTTFPPVVLESSVNSALFEAFSPGATVSDTRIYPNQSINSIGGLVLPGLLTNDSNVLYIRAVDQSGAASPYVGSYSVFVKRVSGNLLLVDAYGTPNPSIQAFYGAQLANLGFLNFDTLQLYEKVNNLFTQQSPDNFTQAKIFGFFKGIIWIGDQANVSLAFAQRTVSEFFNKDGRMLMSIYVAGNFDEQSQFLDFTPASSLFSPPDTTFILSDTAFVQPVASGWPVLKSTAFTAVVKPFRLSPGAEEIYRAELLGRNTQNLSITPWPGLSTVMAMQKNNQGKSRFLFTTLELHRLNGNANMDQFFQKLLIDEFEL